MKVNVVTKNGMSTLSVKTDFNEVLDKNLAAICDAIANKGIVLTMNQRQAFLGLWRTADEFEITKTKWV